MQFILTLQTNIRAKINAIVDVNIDKVTSGSESILVRNTATFTDANSDTAKAGQSALEQVYKSRSVADIFGTQYGAVTVTDISTDYAANPSKTNACNFLLVHSDVGCYPKASVSTPCRLAVCLSL